MTTIASRKAKGRTFQNKIASHIVANDVKLSPDDAKGCQMGHAGEDITLSARARRSFPFTVECKKKQAFSVYAYFDQAAAKRHLGEPIVVIEADRREPLMLQRWARFLADQRELRELRELLEEARVVIEGLSAAGLARSGDHP